MSYKSTTLSAAQDAAKAIDKADTELVKAVDKAIAKAKAEKAAKEKELRPDQIRDGVKAVAEKITEYGVNQFTAREIGKMIGYTEAFVAKVIAEMEEE
jgi:transcriptional regulator NrdR family protein